MILAQLLMLYLNKRKRKEKLQLFFINEIFCESSSTTIRFIPPHPSSPLWVCSLEVWSPEVSTCRTPLPQNTPSSYYCGDPKAIMLTHCRLTDHGYC